MTPAAANPWNLTVAERIAAGKAARSRRPRSSIGDYEPRPGRPDAVKVITDQEADRVPELIPLRHQRMAASPFAFLRGAAAVMAADLGSMPATGLIVQLCGDAHLANLGIFAGQDRALLFDINDFDETAPGPFEWDVLRLATSFLVAAREAGHPEAFAADLPARIGRVYRDAMSGFAKLKELDIWYYRIDTEMMKAWARKEDSPRGVRAINETEAAARARDGWSAVLKLTHPTPEGRRFNNNPPLLTSLSSEGITTTIPQDMLAAYMSTLAADRHALLSRYRLIDIGHKVVGVGSVGLLAFVALMQGRDEDDLLVLQVKQAVTSVLEPFTHLATPVPHGRRVVVGQQFLQAASDPFLGWVDGPRGRSFYVRQLRDMKWSPDLTSMSREAYVSYANLCGAALARAHARAGDAVATAAYLGGSDRFPQAVERFAIAYAHQNEEDYKSFKAAVDSGALPASTTGEGVRLNVSEQGYVYLGQNGPGT